MDKTMKTHHKLIFGDAENMKELEDKSVHLVVTSPPYFNAPFDYPDLFESYEVYLSEMREITKELVVFHHQLKFTSSGYNFNLTFYKS